MDNNNLYGQDNANNDQGQSYQPNQNQTYQQEPTGYDPMTGQPIYGQQQGYQQQGCQQQGYQQGYQPQYQQQDQTYQQQVYQQGYQQPTYVQNGGLEEPVSIGEWMLTTLILLIPCVNIVMIFVWAFGSNTKKSKANYFKAALLWFVISIGIGLVIGVLTAILGLSLFSYIYS